MSVALHSPKTPETTPEETSKFVAAADRPLRVGERKYRQSVRKFDLWSVLKVSLGLNLFGLIISMLAVVVTWLLLSAVGVINGFEKFVGELLASKNFTFLDIRLFLGFTLVGLVIVIFNTIVITLAAALYNLFAEIFGGVEMTIVESEVTRPV